ncbi:PAS domain-containing protein [Streptomyces sp. ISL-99]|uniref:PAS domain-containing protein n=1 Tax=Streptomyces sp. ISL-99 TaxID=2819193 RepID=UPI001BEC576D|nr:PAS domain-containing protein [Streptomyces sp. ISL-99]
MSRIPADQQVGRRNGEFLVGEDARVVESRLRQVLEMGRPVVFTEQSSRMRRDSHRELVVSASAFRMENSSGRVIGVTELVEDVTDRHRARRRLASRPPASGTVPNLPPFVAHGSRPTLTLNVAASSRRDRSAAKRRPADGRVPNIGRLHLAWA